MSTINNEIQKRLHFRIAQGREKLALSHIMLEKGHYNNSVLFSYLSLFYLVRVFLIENDTDSDNSLKIVELIRKYYTSTWDTVDIKMMLSKSRMPRDIDSVPHRASREEAEQCYHNAAVLMNEVLQRHPNSSQKPT